MTETREGTTPAGTSGRTVLRLGRYKELLVRLAEKEGRTISAQAKIVIEAAAAAAGIYFGQEEEWRQ